MEEEPDHLKFAPLANNWMGLFAILLVKVNLQVVGLYAGKYAQIISLTAQLSVLLIYKNAINRQKKWLNNLFNSLPKLLLLT